MKKLFLLSAAMLAFSAVPAHAGTHFSFGIFAPQPVYVAPPPPRYVVHPVAYSYYAPVEYVSYDRWHRPAYKNKQCKKHGRHDHHDHGRGHW